MARSTYYSLLKYLRHNEAKSFRTVLEVEDLPQDDHWYDYDLLVKAIRLNRKRMVNHLLDKRCRVNKPARLGTEGRPTPLHMVAEKLGWCDVVEKMLRLKARVTDVDADGNTPIHLAFMRNQQSHRIIDLLLKYYMTQSIRDIRNKDGLGLMHIACTRADVQFVRDFFEVGMSDIFSQVSPHCDSTYAGYSPLHFAVKAGKHSIVDFLGQWEADMYAQDRNGSTPLHLALEKRDSTTIDILCYCDSRNENYVNAFGVSHFMAVCAGSDAGVVEQYLHVAEATGLSTRGLLNGRVQQVPDHPIAGYTPMHFACEFGRAETVRGLLCIGAWDQCAATTTKLKLTPYELAAKQQHAQICVILEQYNDNSRQQAIQQQPQLIVGHLEEDELVESCQALQIICA